MILNLKKRPDWFRPEHPTHCTLWVTRYLTHHQSHLNTHTLRTGKLFREFRVGFPYTPRRRYSTLSLWRSEQVTKTPWCNPTINASHPWRLRNEVIRGRRVIKKNYNHPSYQTLHAITRYFLFLPLDGRPAPPRPFVLQIDATTYEGVDLYKYNAIPFIG